jgi:hypothetical protein
VLTNKSIHELRAIAEGYGVPDVFAKDLNELRQAIELKQVAHIKEPEFVPPVRQEYDTRLMTKRPAKTFTQEEAIELTKPHRVRGLVLTFPDPDRWHMRIGIKEDTGTLRMPPRVFLDCADRIMKC